MLHDWGGLCSIPYSSIGGYVWGVAMLSEKDPFIYGKKSEKEKGSENYD